LFEPNSEYESILIELSKKISKLCKFVCYVPFASWVEECDKIFGICDSGYGSTLLLDKANTEFESYVSVSCIDIVNFINNINGAKEIHIKMDIEGAEYDILPYMLSNWNRNISSLAVEFHRDFYPKRDFEFWYNYSHSIINLLKFGCNFNWWPGEW
jgi:FkbM family methyltransferase